MSKHLIDSKNRHTKKITIKNLFLIQKKKLKNKIKTSMWPKNIIFLKQSDNVQTSGFIFNIFN